NNLWIDSNQQDSKENRWIPGGHSVEELLTQRFFNGCLECSFDSESCNHLVLHNPSLEDSERRRCPRLVPWHHLPE
ncbi:hypothetical protein scyTo_0018248, partial [Scyliorhinus torazame]|nr:hypothetical protein [Scyliorhinus torazame]